MTPLPPRPAASVLLVRGGAGPPLEVYMTQFDGLDARWEAHVDGRYKFHGILDRVEGVGVNLDRRAAARPVP